MKTRLHALPQSPGRPRPRGRAMTRSRTSSSQSGTPTSTDRWIALGEGYILDLRTKQVWAM